MNPFNSESFPAISCNLKCISNAVYCEHASIDDSNFEFNLEFMPLKSAIVQSHASMCCLDVLLLFWCFRVYQNKSL